LGRLISALSCGTQPTPAEAEGTTGLRTALTGFSIKAASTSMWVEKAADFSFVVATHLSEAAIVLLCLQALISKIATPRINKPSTIMIPVSAFMLVGRLLAKAISEFEVAVASVPPTTEGVGAIPA